MIKKGDTVIIITGKDKGKQGTVDSIAKDGQSVVIDSLNMVTKHVKPNRQAGTAGEKVKKPHPIHISNVMLFDNDAKKRTRVGTRIDNKGNKVRFAKQSGNTI